MMGAVDTSGGSQSARFTRKRDGVTLQDFDPGKLERAVSLAWRDSLGDLDPKAVHTVVKTAIAALPFGTVDVETVQDAVETALMRHGFFSVAKSYILYRHERHEARLLRGKAVDPKGLADYIHAGKYARYLPELERREVFEETVLRVERMHIRKFPVYADAIRGAFDFVREKKVLPSMRSMQFGGEAIEANNCRMYNCSFSLVDRLEVFSEALFLLLSGCGVGYSVQYDHVECLPPLVYVNQKSIVHHIVADTIEGWAEALKALVLSYQLGVNVEFSYHLIRPAGSPLKRSGGRAPGHLKLKESLEKIRGVLSAAQGRKLRPIECHRILCHAADAVLSGGIRRSAMIALFSPDDSEMLYAKTGAWYEKDPWFSNANNSAQLIRGDVKKKQFKRIFEMSKQWGEPGFNFTSDPNYGTNPCVPAGTRILTREGYVPIEQRVGQETVVWNGISWRTVTPQITGHDQPLVRVYLSDGTSLACTDYHEWCIATGRWSRDHIEERVKAKDLEVGDVLMRYDMPVVEGGEDLPHAYTHGFWCADGTTEDAGRKVAYLYGGKQDLLAVLDCDRSGKPNIPLDRTRVVLPKHMPEKFFVPTSASTQTRLEWLAGLFDGDGTVVRNPNSAGLQLTSVNLNFLQEVRLLLTTLGVQAKIADAREAGARFLPDGRGGQAEYLTQRSYRVLINATDTHKLVQLGFKTHRLDLSLAQMPPQRDARRFVTVEAVERLPPADVVYCFTEDSNHTGTFEGIVTGQCAEIGLNPKLVIDAQVQADLAMRGVSVELGAVYTGWSFCNLCEINAAKFESFEDFKKAAEAATLIGTLQASYTEMPYLGWVSETIAKREALLGIGMTGMLDKPEIACNPEFQKQVALQIKDDNAEFAAWFGIRPAARTTCIKPSGTTSLELGCVASGHHAHHARRYIRRVTADELEFVFQAFKKVNPGMCVRKPDGKWVVEFPVEAPAGATLKGDLGAIEFLNMVLSTQQNWVLPGTREDNGSPGLNHNVSNTVTVRPEEWDAVAEYLWENREFFTGVSLLPSTGDKDYAFAPNEAIVTPADEHRWNDLLIAYKAVDYTALREESDDTTLSSEAACVGGVCAIV